MGRLTIIDGFRGFFLLFMGVHHFNTILGTTLGMLNHHRLGWVEDAQGFVFISGLVVGVVYGRKFMRRPGEIFTPILARVRTIYLHQATLILILLAAALMLGPDAARAFRDFVQAPATFTGASLLLLTAAPHMGILPMYIYFLLVTPFAFRLLAKGWDVPFALILLGSWLFAQTGLTELAADGLGGALGIRFNLGFNIFGWQALFFSGLYFGFRMVERPVDLDFLRQDQYRAAFLITLAIVAGLAIFDRIVGGEVFGDAYSTALMAHTDRGLLAWIYPFAFLLDLFAVVWLLRVGATDKAGWIRGLSRLVAWVFTARPLVFLGQHSLHVFSFHILVFYALAQFAPGLGLGEFGASLLLIASVASLWLAAWGHAWLQARDAARADDAASAAVRR